MSRNLKRKLLATLFVPMLGLSAGSAMAQGTNKGSGDANRMLNPNSATANPMTWDKPMFDRLDKNKDGRISREEAEAEPMMKDHWSKLDKANKGMVSREDYDKYSATHRTLNPNSATPKGNPSAGGPAPTTTK